MIVTRGLSRSFGRVEAVRGLDVEIGAGEIVGFLGPNGAGKTTTLRMLATLLRPTDGTATVAGHDLLADPRGVRRAIGYVRQGGSADPTRPVREELELQASLYGLRPPREHVARVCEAFGLTGLADRPPAALSGGQRRRLDLALGLIHRPRVLFLDEPTTGLDPRTRAALWDHVRRLREEGTTVLVSTHYLEEAEALYDRVLIIDGGAIVADGPPSALKSRAGGTLGDAYLALTADA
ncbi:ABC transporter ATP-binding protein [Bailinhaonella thermotolerans]|uniref:ABC transporter ATP-binding protein n=2 Tax=Bailinhaonella thermotolerans TaxID=1070861 RepID=A0A3A4AUT0_9ACTN|nr:ABC transporter ATP-binding protein [Bailinhaonella thermotolerans]